MIRNRFGRSVIPLAVAVLLLAAGMPLFAHGGGGPGGHPSDSPGPPHQWGGGTDGLGCGKGRNRPGSPVEFVNTFTGNLTIRDIPVFYHSVGDPLPFVPMFNSQSARTGPLGDRWTHSYNARIVNDAPYGVTVIEGNGWEHYFTGSDTYTAPPGVFDKLERKYVGGGAWDGWLLTRPNCQMLWFDTSGRLKTVTDGTPLTWNFGYSDGRLVVVIDPLGRETTLTYTGDLLTRVTVPGGLYADFQYDSHSPKRLWKITDAAGDTYTFGYSGTRVTSITDPNGRQVWYQYGTYDNRTVLTGTGITGLSDSTVSFGYSSQPYNEFWADVTDTKDGQSRVTRHVYPATGDIMGALTGAIVDVGGIAAGEAYMYDSDFRLTTYRDSYQPESGGKDHVHRFYYNDGANPSRVTKYIDPENWTGSTASPSYDFQYDTLGNLTDIVTPEDRETQFQYYAGTNRLYKIILKDEYPNGTPVDRITRFFYWGSDMGYRLKGIVNARGYATYFYYDSNCYLDYIDPPTGGNTDFTCNAVGDITAVTDGNGNTTSYSYEELHRLTQITYPDVGAGQKSRIFDWLSCGLEQVTDENGRITKFEYDLDTKWVHKVIEDYGGLGYQTTYAYDEVGNPVSVTNARGKTREYTWDGADRLVRADYPDNTYETWTLRDDGRVYQHRDGRGRITTYRYDADDRLSGSGSYKAIDYPNDTDVQVVQDEDGLVTSFTDGTGTTSLVYYPSTWVKSITNGAGEVVTYEYDGVGDVSRIKTPDNLYFQYTYNALNQINWTKSPNYIEFDFSYDNGGRRYRTTQPTVTYREYRYNARNWYTGLRHWATPSGQWLYNPYYYYNDGALWDHTGNPLRRLEYFPGEGNYYHMTTFRYDGVYRLTEETRRDYWGTLEYSLGYGYDAVGNRTSMTRAGVNYTYTYDDNDKLTAVSGGGQSASFGYDGAGNMTSVSGTMFGSWTLSYDDESRLTSVTYPGGTDSFSYNALGQKMRAVLGGTAYRYVYNGDRVMEETNDAGTVTTRYMTESGSYYSPLINQFRTGCRCRWPLEDGAGTVRGLAANIGGEMSDWYELDAFGVELSSSGASRNDYRFGGAWGYMTDPSGLLQLGHRFYWPEIGRFVQQDPIADGVNWYAYVGNNPVVWIDPEGLDGAGVSGSGTVDAGLGFIGAGATGSGGLGIFWGGEEGVQLGGVASGGAFAGGTYGGGDAGKGWGKAWPCGPKKHGTAIGGFAGGGINAFLTNADNPEDLAGAATVANVNIGKGERVLTVQVSESANGVWMVSVGCPPLPGAGAVGATSRYNTLTAAKPVTWSGIKRGIGRGVRRLGSWLF